MTPGGTLRCSSASALIAALAGYFLNPLAPRAQGRHRRLDGLLRNPTFKASDATLHRSERFANSRAIFFELRGNTDKAP